MCCRARFRRTQASVISIPWRSWSHTYHLVRGRRTNCAPAAVMKFTPLTHGHETSWLPGLSRHILFRIFGYSGLLCAVISHAGVDVGRDRACSTSTVLRELNSYYPTPISVSRDGRIVLERAQTQTPDRSTLIAVDAHMGKVIARLEWDAQITHALWRPDSRFVSFFSQEKETNVRRLILWNVDHDQTTVISTPPAVNQPLVRWSPDGSKLAFSEGGQALVIVNVEGGHKAIVYAGPFAMFDWSADSRHLALAPDNESRQVLIVSADSQEISERIDTSGRVSDLAWEPRKNILMLIQQKDGSRSFIEYDRLKRTERILFSADSGIRSPVWLERNHGYLFQWSRFGTEGLFLGSEKKGTLPKCLISNGTSRFVERLSADDRIAIAHRSETSVELLSVNVESLNQKIIAAANVSALGRTVPQRATVTSSDGTKIPILFWRSPNKRTGSRALVIRVRATPHDADSSMWQEDIQMYLKHGMDFMSVNYRGSTGYGTHFEEAGGQKERSQDVLAACEYAHSTLGVPYERIALLGHSNGATIALGAALISPRHMGFLFLASLPGLPKDWQTYGNAQGRRPFVIAFHGEKDTILSPSAAHRLIERVFGPGVLDPTSNWHVIADEDHVLHLPSSWAYVHSSLLQIVGSSCYPQE
jgi:dipeptidyl aminopeptidase/acylaminoacyl peptidase